MPGSGPYHADAARLTMLARQALAAMAALPILPFEAKFGAAPLLILAPHPDDESLGCGGLIAEACARGQPPTVAVLTDGTMSHPNSRAYPSDRLRMVREAEAVAATALLGLPRDRLSFLGYRDTQAPCEGATLQQAADRLAQLIEAGGCDTVVTSWQHDPHCDHEAAAAIARLACDMTGARLLAYPVWGLTLPPDQAIDQNAIEGFRLDVTRHVKRKRAAILAHQSQYAGLIEDDPGGFQMQPGFMALFLSGSEVFLEHS